MVIIVPYRRGGRGAERGRGACAARIGVKLGSRTIVEFVVGTRGGRVEGRGPCACPGWGKRAPGTQDKHKATASAPLHPLSLHRWPARCVNLTLMRGACAARRRG